MESRQSTSLYKDLPEFLANHLASKNKLADGSTCITHTRIRSDAENIYGGAYNIPAEKLETFYALYYNHVFVKNRKEYITEKQLNNNGPILIDLDFRYDYAVTERQHTDDYVIDFIGTCLTRLTQCFAFTAGQEFTICIYEKPHINRLKEKGITKDGIHINIGIQADNTLQMMLRDRILKVVSDEVDALPWTEGHTWDKVYDDGVSKGCVNWQLYGSRKPANEAYELTKMFACTYDASDGDFSLNEVSVVDAVTAETFHTFTAQYTGCTKVAIHPDIQSKYDAARNSSATTAKGRSRRRITLLSDDDDSSTDGESGTSSFIRLVDIVDYATLVQAVKANVLDRLDRDEYHLREVHEYAQLLPSQFYDAGSHVLNRQVAFALKDTSPKLFLSWIMLRSKAADFEYNTIPALFSDWKKYFNVSDVRGVTKYSIMYWAKQYSPEEYLLVKNNTISHYIDVSIYEGQTEFDIAMVLHQMYKDKYMCAGVNNKGLWYVFKHHRWEPDKGISLRMSISTHMYALYASKQTDLLAEMQQYEAGDERQEKCKKSAACVGQLMQKLKKTCDKNNIMREAMELFYDGKFIESMDTNRYLMGFKNGVVDFAAKTFRPGVPQDYITKSTGINYVPYEKLTAKQKVIERNVVDFMEKLFPIAGVNAYMWDHASSCLIGVVKNQTFNIYYGSGSNGKSLFVDLMSATIRDYKAVVPLSLVTEKRASVGQTSSEVMQLKGVRYAVMQELSKGTKLNEGPMKALTSGDDLQGRSLFLESETFKPQFNLVVCTNAMFDIESNDDGTWRRIRKCDFISKFVDESDTNEYNAEFIFKKDKTLSEKLDEMAPIFASMLVKRAFETNGVVVDCPEVMSASNMYRKTQDNITAFMTECVIRSKNPTDKIGKVGLREAYKIWHANENGGKKLPKSSELHEAMDTRFGSFKKVGGGWFGVTFAEDLQEDDIDILTDF